MATRRTGRDSNDYILGTTVGRKQSPEIEYAFQDELRRVVAMLMQEKGLYQNVRVAKDVFDPHSSKEFPAQSLVAEFGKRPFQPHCKHDSRSARARAFGSGPIGAPPLNTPHDELPLDFYLPSIDHHCQQCRAPKVFVCHSCPHDFDTPYQILADDTEQVFTWHYACATCHRSFLTFQVRRFGLALQLTGRSAPFRPKIDPAFPATIEEIVKDASVAEAEGDCPAAYYHLRTAIEHFIKQELGIPVDEKIEGTDLCDRYNAAIDTRLKQGFPTLGPLVNELSSGLHSRKTDRERFRKMLGDFADHLDAKKLFAKYQPPAAAGK